MKYGLLIETIEKTRKGTLIKYGELNFIINFLDNLLSLRNDFSKFNNLLKQFSLPQINKSDLPEYYILEFDKKDEMEQIANILIQYSSNPLIYEIAKNPENLSIIINKLK